VSVPLRSSLLVELTFLGHALESLTGILDPILVLIALRRQQFYNLERTAGTEPAKRAGGVANVLADRIFAHGQQWTLHRTLKTAYSECIFRIIAVSAHGGENCLRLRRPFAAETITYLFQYLTAMI